MFSVDSVLALVLLTAPPGSTESAAHLESLYPSVRQHMQTLALKWEILDPREIRYILARQEDFQTDLNLLRRRYRELAGAPALSDSTRFPERAIVNELLAFNRTYRQHVDVRQPVELVHWWELRVALQETDRLFHIWDTVRDARCDYYYVTVRRQALKRLREIVGEEAYSNAELPPCVPLWRFQTLN